MATPKIPALLDLTQYDFTLTPGTYTDLVAGTLGSTADPSDGFDVAVLSAAQLPEGMNAELPGTDADLLEAGAVAPIFSTTPGANLAAQLQPVSDAIDVDLTAFSGLVTPAAPSGTTTAAPPASAPPTSGPTGAPTVPGTGLQTPNQPPGGNFPPAPPSGLGQ